jgi:hypothetical protein
VSDGAHLLGAAGAASSLHARAAGGGWCGDDRKICDHTLKARRARRSPTSVPRLVDRTAAPTSDSALTLSMAFLFLIFYHWKVYEKPHTKPHFYLNSLKEARVEIAGCDFF